MASGPLTSWQIDGKIMEIVTDFILGGCKKNYDQPRQHIQKQRHYFATKFHLVKAVVFPVVMYGCESWTVKKAEHRRIDAFGVGEDS